MSIAGARVLGAGLLVLALTACGRGTEEVPTEASATARSGAGALACGRIVFVESLDEHHAHMRVVPAAGGVPASVAKEPLPGVDAQFPAAVSADGQALLVLAAGGEPGSFRDRFGRLELAELPGAVAAFGPEGVMLRNPSLAPDGSWLAYESDADGFRDLYRIGFGSKQPLRLTHAPEGSFEPAISPDGSRIAFVSSRDGNAELYLMTADGGDAQRLTESPGDDSAPAWSPDGRWLAFLSARDRARGTDVYLFEFDAGRVKGPARTLVSESRTRSVIARDLAFSPDGKQLAFAEQYPGQGRADLRVVALADGETRWRSTAQTIDEHPAWSPDARFIAFTRGHERGSDIVRLALEEGTVERLTAGDGRYWLPRWILDPGCARVQAEAVEPVSSGQG